MEDRLSNKAEKQASDGYNIQRVVGNGKVASQFKGVSDIDIWRAFKDGSRAAFIHIYNEYFDQLYAYSRQFTQDEDLIKDCIQDLFVDINQSKHRLSETDNILLYLLKSIKRLIIHRLKKEKSLTQFDPKLNGLNFDMDISIEQKIIDRQLDEEKVQKLRNAVNALTVRQREAIFYFYYNGFSHEQISELMGISSIKATQNLIYRAIKELREIIALIVSCLLLIR